ncbi:hypothetical protein [Bifidobacterium oedipodis]|uniref:Uncharacterized protein n=1 Tax=Bifidobacterium oedipodis TaxID=2675322 RepID=A0A7Y0ENH8_9BIFI|nr:hypothetical protein [Bifidobacterium sp. DSM 109957]NMM93427.1 hypothetical protein [Bifidobacterium sp. DSM 109957]
MDNISKIMVADGRVRLCEFPMPPVVSDASLARDMALNWLTKSGRKRVQAADALVLYWDNEVMSRLNQVLAPFCQYLSWSLAPTIAATGMLPEDIPLDAYWRVETIDLNRQGRLFISVKPDWLHSIAEFNRIVDRVLPQLDPSLDLRLYEDPYSNPNRIGLCTATGIVPWSVAQGYVAACDRFTKA